VSYLLQIDGGGRRLFQDQVTLPGAAALWHFCNYAFDWAPKNMEDFSIVAVPGIAKEKEIQRYFDQGGAQMAEKPPKTAFSVVSTLPLKVPDPPRPLGPAGQQLWESIQGEYNIQDQGGVAMLLVGCQAFDRAEKLRVEIDRDGEVVRLRNGNIRSHPALRDEVQARAQLMRCLEKLGLNLEPIKSIGRPSGSFNR
jgi:hypothetical protein